MTKVCPIADSKRRANTRVYGVYPVYAHGLTATGKKFKIHTLADNICLGGLFLWLPYSPNVDVKLFTFITLPSGAAIASLGQILRVETKPCERYGIAVSFVNSRLFASAA